MREVEKSASSPSSVKFSQCSNKACRTGISINADASVKNTTEVRKSATAVVNAALSDCEGAGNKDHQTEAPCDDSPRVVRKVQAITLTLGHIALSLFTLGLLLSLLSIKLLSPSPWTLSLFTVLGMGMGLAFSFLYSRNLKIKNNINSVLGTNVGLKGLQHLVGNLPSWLSYSEKERIEWLNTVMEEMWPFLDRGICKMIKEIVTPIINDQLKTLKVPIKNISFKQLTFGEAPFRIESIWANEDGRNGLEMEFGIRWCGDANITLAIELSAGVTETKMCPRIEHISFAASVRVRLSPLINQSPGFGAILVAFPTAPRYKYTLDCGKLGGTYSAAMIKPIIASITSNIMNSMLVWPQRLVVPIFWDDPLILQKIARLYYRHQGVIKVEVLRAENLVASDLNGYSDPFVQLSTDGQYRPETKVVKKNLNPVWEQSFWLLVQEPKSQNMNISVFDKDLFSMSELIKLNFKDTIGSREVIGRALVSLKEVTAVEPQPVTNWYHLGEGAWGDPGGCGKGCGRVQLRMTYRSFDNILPPEPIGAARGILLARVMKCSELNNSGKPLTIYCQIKCEEHEEYNTALVTAAPGQDHVFTWRNAVEFHDVRFDCNLKINVMERSVLTGDDKLGFIELPVTEIAKARDRNHVSDRDEAGHLAQSFRIEEADYGKIAVILRFVPYF